MQEVVRVHILQKPSQANNLTPKQKGKRVRKAGRGAEGPYLVCKARSRTRRLHARSREALLGCSGHMGWSDKGTLVVWFPDMKEGAGRGATPLLPPPQD